MTIFTVLCHPLPDSFNGRIARVVQEVGASTGHTVLMHDLYKEKFNPVLSSGELLSRYSFDGQVQGYMDEVSDSDVLIFIHPDWWGQMPAVLKGFIDRIFRPGIAYDYSGDEFLEKELEPLLSDKKGVVFFTTDSEESAGKHPLIDIWQERIFQYCGIDGECHVFYSARKSSFFQKKSYLQTVKEKLLSILL